MADPRYFGKRKTATPQPQLAGGNLYGALVRDPAGRLTALPLGPGEVPTGHPDGPATPPIAAVPGGGALVPLSDGGEPMLFISDGDGSPILVDFTE